MADCAFFWPFWVLNTVVFGWIAQFFVFSLTERIGDFIGNAGVSVPAKFVLGVESSNPLTPYSVS